jgi:hypothetical protein
MAFNQEQFGKFLVGAQAMVDKWAAQYLNIAIRATVEAEELSRYVRIARVERASGQVISRSAYAFIDKQTGDVLKPSSWKAPAKHVRGNINDEWNGLRFCDWHGPASLR